MVERHGGELQIESELGAGTTVRLILPAAADLSGSSGPISSVVHPQRPLPILVLDDDPIILKTLLTILEQDGHTVEAADGGQRGIDAFRDATERRDPMPLLFTALGQPHLSGPPL